MTRKLLTLAMVTALAAAPGLASAKGCLKGAAVGGVAGHVAGKHGVAGAAVGCAVGHHRAKVKDRDAAANQPTTSDAAQTQATAPVNARR
jgi:hypothetical protein